MSEEDMLPDEAAALDKFRAWQAMEELKRRHGAQDWNPSPPCPNCGSMAHFEC